MITSHFCFERARIFLCKGLHSFKDFYLYTSTMSDRTRVQTRIWIFPSRRATIDRFFEIAIAFCSFGKIDPSSIQLTVSFALSRARRDANCHARDTLYEEREERKEREEREETWDR